MIDALLPTGGVPRPNDPMYALTNGHPKALLEIAGQPMVQWVLDALSKSETVRSVTMIGLDPVAAKLRCDKPLHHVPAQGALIQNLLAGARFASEKYPDAKYGLLVSADIPTVTPQALDWIATTAMQTQADGCYTLIRREDMERRFPSAKRTYFHIKEGAFAAGDVNVVATHIANHLPKQIQGLIEARKNLFRQASIIGLDLLIPFAFRQIGLERGSRLIAQRLGINGRALVCPYPEVGMDVDKPVQYELLKRELENQGHG